MKEQAVKEIRNSKLTKNASTGPLISSSNSHLLELRVTPSSLGVPTVELVINMSSMISVGTSG